jgi:8-oxo-(d)GTP phosphatase
MSETVVRAAGGLVLREGGEGQSRLIAVVHRPRYDDWTFPKGKVLPGESEEENALREVLEETGLACRLGRDLGTIGYRDREDRPKVVRYWLMSADGGTFEPNEEVDQLRWMAPDDAARVLTYDHDRELLRRMLAAGNAAVYLVRHGKAGSRSSWTEADELRPLSKTGRRQAESLVKAFRGRDVDRVISSPYVRCVQTVRPLALDRGLSVEVADVLAEGAPLAAVLDLVEELSSTPAVLCSHGDVIPAVVLHLAEGGMRIDGERDWQKGSVWVLEREDGRFATGRYLAPLG